jgi:outer membrane protein TolC
MRQRLEGGASAFRLLAAGLMAAWTAQSVWAAEYFVDPPGKNAARRSATLALQDVLVAAEAFSPEIKAMKAQENIAKNDITVSESYLMPQLDAAFDRSQGMMGDNPALGPVGLRRFVVEPFYQGTAYGLMGSWDVFNLQRYYAIQVAKRQLDYRRALTALTRYHVDVQVSDAYFRASSYKGLAAAWQEVGAFMYNVMVKEVRPLMRSGYQNPVDELLVKDEVTEAGIEKAKDQASYRDARKALAALMGQKEWDFSIPAPLSLSSGAVAIFIPGVSPYVKVAAANLDVSKKFRKEEWAQHMPVVHAQAGLGNATNIPHDEEKNLEGGVGVEMPIFEGFRIVSQVEAASNMIIQRQAEADDAQLQVDFGTAKLDRVIDSAKEAIARLAGEFSDDLRALNLARYRYTNFQGPLVDVREALRDLARVRASQNLELGQLYFGKAAKALLNGATLPAKTSRS